MPETMKESEIRLSNSSEKNRELNNYSRRKKTI